MDIYGKKFFWIIIFINSILVDGKSLGDPPEPDITLLSRVTKGKQMNMTCVAGSNAGGSALAFITPLGGVYTNPRQVSIYTSTEGSVYPSDKYDCDFMPTCAGSWRKWNDQEVVVARWGYHDLAPVTDERWENFPTYYSQRQKTVSYNFTGTMHSVGLSVRTQGEVSVEFCTEKNNRWRSNDITCYWIINDNSIKLMTLWECPKRGIQDPRIYPNHCKQKSSATGIQVNKSRWIHFKLNLSQTGIIKVEYQNLILLNFNISSVLQIEQILLRNTEKAIWKVHDYNYLSILQEKYPDPTKWRPVGPTLQADDTGLVCVELYVATCQNCTFNFRFNHLSEIIEIRGNSTQFMQHWELIRLEMGATQYTEYSLQVQVSGSSGAGYWLIGNVRRCHKQETRTISLTVPMNENDVISCQVLNQPDKWGSIHEGKITNINLDACTNVTYTGSKCGVSCWAALGTDCSGVIVCEPTSSHKGAPRCACAAGYTRALCQDMSYPPLNVKMNWVNDKVSVTWDYSSAFSTSSYDISTVISIDLIRTMLVSNPYFYKNYTVSKQNNNHYSYEVPDDVPLSSTYRVRVSAVSGAQSRGTAVNVDSPAVPPRLVGHVTCGTRTNATQHITVPAAHPDTLTTRSFIYILICNSTNTDKSSSVTNENNLQMKLNSWSKCTGTSWIAATFSATDKSRIFIVGHSGDRTKNKPLTPDSYMINVIFVNEYNRDEKYVISATTTLSMETESNPALYALLILLIIPVIVLFVYYWKRKKISNVAVAYHVISADSISNWHAQFNLKNNKNVIKFSKYTKELLENSLLVEQYKSFPRGPTKSCDYGMHEKNAFKNRFDKLTAYDHSRVKLPIMNDDPYSDFINANYINGYMQPKAYIATQDPKLNTMADFWRMVWEENVSLIVMLTNNLKDNKYEQYWPEKEEERNFIDISVQLLLEDVYADFVIRKFKVKYNESERQVQHLQYTSWPNKKVPLYPQLLVPFLQKIRATSRGNAPMVVHCSNGMGRTGAIILLDICLQLSQKNEEIKPFKYVHLMREQRVDMVACIDQYLLVHAVLLEYLLAPDSSIACHNLSEVYNEILNSERLTHEVTYLKEIEWHNRIMKEHTDTATPEVVSYNCYGEYVSILNPLPVDGFRMKGQYIFIPTPQIDETKSFWAMIIEHDVGVVVVFKDNSHNAINWPVGVEQILAFSDMTLECISKTVTTFYTKYKLQIQNKINEQARSIQLLHFTETLQYEDPACAQQLAALTDEVQQLAQAQQRRPAVLSGNAAAASLLATLAHVLERMRELQQCDVLDSLRAVRACGLSFLPDRSQLQLLYAAAAAAVRTGLLDGYMPPDHPPL